MPFNFNFVPFLALYMCQSNPSRGTFSWGQKNHEHAVASELNARVRTCRTLQQFSSPIQYQYYNIDDQTVCSSFKPLFHFPFHLSFLLLSNPSHFFSFNLLQWKVWLPSRLPFRPPHFSLPDPEPLFFHPKPFFSTKEAPFHPFLLVPR